MHKVFPERIAPSAMIPFLFFTGLSFVHQLKSMRCFFENASLSALWDEYSTGTEEQQAFLNEHYHILYDCARASGWDGNTWERRDKDYSFPTPDKMDFTVRPEEYVGD